MTKLPFIVVFSFGLVGAAFGDNWYLIGDVGGYFSSNASAKKMWGTTPTVLIGSGFEQDSGLGGELGLVLLGGKGTPSVSGTLQPGESLAEQGTLLEVPVRLLYRFGKKGEWRPYIGIQASYYSFKETITDTVYGFSNGEAQLSASGFGAGSFIGVDFGDGFGIEARYTSCSLKGKVDSNTSPYVAVAYSGVDLGGFFLVGVFKINL